MSALDDFLKFLKKYFVIVCVLVGLSAALFYAFFPFAPDMTLQTFSLKSSKGEPTSFQIPDTFIARGPIKSAYKIKNKSPYFTHVIVEFKYPDLLSWESFEYNKLGSKFDQKNQLPELYKVSLKINSGTDFSARKAFEYRLYAFYNTGITRYELSLYRPRTEGYSEKEIKWDAYFHRDRYQFLDEDGTTYRIECVNEEFGERVNPGGNYLCTAVTDFNKDVFLTYKFSTKLLEDWREIDRNVRALTRHFILSSATDSLKSKDKK